MKKKENPLSWFTGLPFDQHAFILHYKIRFFVYRPASDLHVNDLISDSGVFGLDKKSHNTRMKKT